MRRDALTSLLEMLTQHPILVSQYVATLVDRLSARITDEEKAVREVARTVLKTAFLPQIRGEALAPFVHPLMLHLCSAMTHLNDS
eukprot:2761473-Pyramimonas_sp.AAC.1